MRLIQKSATALSFGLGLAMLGGGALQAAPAAWHQDYGSAYPDLRSLVDRTQTDLRAAEELEANKEKARERYRKAQRFLSNFDKHLSRGKFDKGKLDDCITELKRILDNNTLQASSRDALTRDLEDLRMARDRH